MSKKNSQPTAIPPFVVRDCALVMQSTGQKAYSLRELAEELRTIPLESVYHHFWGRLLQPSFDEPEYANDFAAWAFRSVHDKIGAERLSMIDPTQYGELSDLRDVLIEVLEMRIGEGGHPAWAMAAEPFHFLCSQIVVFDTGVTIAEPRQLAAAVPQLTSSSIYYHFIDARRRTTGRVDDFSAWLGQWNGRYAALAGALDAIDPFFSSLKYDRERLAAIFIKHFTGEAA